MKKLFTSIFILMLGLATFAQTPTTFNYQAVLRDASGGILKNQEVEISIVLLQGSVTGSEVFSETHSTSTNSLGLVNLQIGSVNTSGIETIDWSAGPYFIQISVDGTIMGTSQLLSVPFAMHALTVENDNVEDADADPANELQDISLSGTELSISQGSAVDLSVLQDGTGTDNQDLYLYENYLSITKGNSVKLPFISSEQDGDATNELQALSISNDTIFLTNGNYVKLPVASALADADNDTKIQVEENPDEDMLRVDLAGDETLTMSNSTGTFLKLPTNDANSSLKISNSDSTLVFGVDGRGLLNGDGSGLSNVKSLTNTIGGNQRYQITANYGSYNAVRTVSFTAPSSGVCFVMASGYVDWESTGWDLLLSGILCDQNPNSSWTAENEWYSYLNILTDYNCADSSDQYTSFAQHRCISVSEGSHTFYLWANKYTSSSKTEVGDVNLTVLFFPTGGTGSATLKSTEIGEAEESKEPFDRSRQRNVDGSYSAIQTDNEYEIKSPPLDELETQKKINQQQEERIKELEKKLELLLQEKIE